MEIVKTLVKKGPQYLSLLNLLLMDETSESKVKQLERIFLQLNNHNIELKNRIAWQISKAHTKCTLEQLDKWEPKVGNKHCQLAIQYLNIYKDGAEVT